MPAFFAVILQVPFTFPFYGKDFGIGGFPCFYRITLCKTCYFLSQKWTVLLFNFIVVAFTLAVAVKTVPSSFVSFVPQVSQILSCCSGASTVASTVTFHSPNLCPSAGLSSVITSPHLLQVFVRLPFFSAGRLFCYLGNIVMSKCRNFLDIFFSIAVFSSTVLALFTLFCTGGFFIHCIVFGEIMSKYWDLFCNNIVASVAGFGENSFFSTGSCYCCFNIIMSKCVNSLNIIFRFTAFSCTMLALFLRLQYKLVLYPQYTLQNRGDLEQELYYLHYFYRNNVSHKRYKHRFPSNLIQCMLPALLLPYLLYNV